MELYKGRPDTNEGRLEMEIRVYDFLDDHGIEYWRTDHAPADTMEVCSEIDGIVIAPSFTNSSIEFLSSINLSFILS